MFSKCGKRHVFLLYISSVRCCAHLSSPVKSQQTPQTLGTTMLLPNWAAWRRAVRGHWRDGGSRGGRDWPLPGLACPPREAGCASALQRCFCGSLSLWDMALLSIGSGCCPRGNACSALIPVRGNRGHGRRSADLP